MRTLFFQLFSLFTLFDCSASVLTDHIQEIIHREDRILKTFGLSYSDDADFSYIETDLLKYGIHLQIIDQTHHKRLSEPLKKQYSSRNTPPYLLAQILAHLNAYHHCIEHRIPIALILEKDAFIYTDLEELFPLIEELNRKVPSWDILFTDVHYHLPKDGSLAAPQLSINGAILPTHTKLSKTLSLVNCRYGTTAYLISQSGMKKILHFYQKHWLDLPYDQALFKIPRLKIFSANHDIITNMHRCPKYDSWLAECIKSSLKNGKTAIIEKSLCPGLQRIRPQELLLPVNWELIQPYIQKKFESLANCVWIDELLHDLPTIESEEIIIETSGKILSGVKEVSEAIFLNEPIDVSVVEQPQPVDIDSTFPFNTKMNLSDEQKDFLAYQYIQLFPNHYIVCLFPSAQGLDHIAENILQQHGEILYKNELMINEAGSLEFIKLIYHGENWLGNESNHFKLGRVKAEACFPPHLLSHSPLRVYLYYSPSLEAVKKAKASIRRVYQNSNDSVHINDFAYQAQMIGATVFNKGSIDTLNKRKPCDAPNFNWLLSHFQLLMSKNALSVDHYCIDTSGSLAAYGLRDCQDFDVLHDSNDCLPPCQGIQSHRSYLKFHTLPLEEMLWNPNCHFYYQGVKFLSLDLVKAMKMNRNQSKDIMDIKLIESLHD